MTDKDEKKLRLWAEGLTSYVVDGFIALHDPKKQYIGEYRGDRPRMKDENLRQILIDMFIEATVFGANWAITNCEVEDDDDIEPWKG